MVTEWTDSEKYGFLTGILFNIDLIVRYRSNTAEAVYAIEEQLKRIEDESPIRIIGEDE